MLRGFLVQSKTLLLGLGQRNISSLIQTKGFIDGVWRDASNEKMFPVLNPANGEKIICVADMTADDTKLAIRAAHTALHSSEWAGLTAKERSALLKNWYKLIKQNKDVIGKIMTAESGKPLAESFGEVDYGNSFVEWFAEEARRIYGDVIPSPVPNRETIVWKQPIGVAGLITPWNFPLAMYTRKAAAALAAGCTIVLKPSEETPLTALAITKLAEEACFPCGVINVVPTTNSAAVGGLFCKSPDVHAISFTGSTKVGRLLYRNSAQGIKRISLELGGNAPFIVFTSADVDKAVDGAMISKFRNCGQTCVSANRFFVQEGIYTQFVELLAYRVKGLKMGSGKDIGVQIGPLINKQQLDKVSEFVEDAKKNKATVVCGGKAQPKIGSLFYEPTIITNVKPNMKIYQEEVFGPVISISKFKDEKDAISRANNTQRGLAGYFYSTDHKQIFRVARQLEVGMVGVNEGLISVAEAPFGGVKESGIGREGSRYGIDEFTEIKYVCMGNLGC